MGDHSKKEKKDKKEKKEKRSETTDAGVKKAKKAKKEKKERKRESLAAVSDALETALERRSATPERELPVDGDGDVDMNEGGDEQEEQGGSGSTKIAASALVTEEALNAALVPFAHPLIVEEKDVKKVLKGVKKSAKHKTLRRGVKEVVKTLRKSASGAAPASSSLENPSAICIIAADISPMDVISHLPVLCEDHNVPYLYVKSRAQLGEASATKRPTSVVLVCREGKGNGEKVDEEWRETYAGLVKLAVKAGRTVRK